MAVFVRIVGWLSFVIGVIGLLASLWMRAGFLASGMAGAILGGALLIVLSEIASDIRLMRKRGDPAPTNQANSRALGVLGALSGSKGE